MERTCQRCHETLRDEDRYCPSCGLPQLVYVAAESPLVALGSEIESVATGEQGGPHSGTASLQAAAGSHGIAWRPALRAAVFLAIPAGVLCSNISIIGPSLALVWMVGASVWAVALYGRRTRVKRLSKATGARIGLITGVMASWLTLGFNGLSIWLSRFVFHQSAQLDSEWTTFVDRVVQIDQGLYSQMGVNSAQLMQQLQLQRVSMLSAEGRAGFPLMFFLTSAMFLVFFAAIGGALGARFMTLSPRPHA